MASVCIPGMPPVEIGFLQPVLDSPQFQRLRTRKQLGLNDLVFPGAVHTRLEHSIGVLALTQRLCRLQQLPEPESRRLQAFALLHDIGHGPFSHQVEPVLPGNHHEQGLRILAQLEKPLHAVGMEFSEIQQMLSGNDPLAKYVSDRNLGTDKLDYLFRDALHIGFHGTPDIERIQMATRMTPDGPAIEEKYVEDAKMLQRFYSYLHQHGYLNKTALAAQRMLQRALQEMLCQDSCGKCSADIWEMGDEELLAKLKNGPELSRILSEKLNRREIYKSFLVLKPTGYGYTERKADKPVSVLEFPRAVLRAFCEKMQSPAGLIQAENQLASLLKIQGGAILCAAMPYFRKLLPQDMRVYSNNGKGNYWLLENDLEHRKSLEGDYLRTFSIRLLCRPEDRERLASSSKLQDAVRSILPET